MEELIKPAIQAVKTGEIQFVPERFDKIYFNWTDNIRDWCISRQLWWGHRIPAYYCDKCGEVIVAKEAPATCPKCGDDQLTQDEDTLDTWFSSALWPFSTLGWPQETEDYKYFYPTNVLVTGYDIIFFWVVRMVFSGFEYTGKAPFDKVLIHGLVRDSQGRKMSKSLGNGIDPLEIIDQYGADALRLTLITGNAPGNDMRFYMERVEASRNFANKVWNASRFIMMNLEKAETSDAMDPATLTDADKWILSKANTLVKDVTENLENFELGIGVQKIYDFVWEEFCDWYIEMVKPRLYSESDETKAGAMWTLKQVLTTSLKLLHPYMPFLTEEIYCTLKEMESSSAEEDSIMISQWPLFDNGMNYYSEEGAVETIKAAVKSIRNIRTEMNVPPSRKATVIVVSENEAIRDIFKNSKVFFATLGYASEVLIQSDKAGIMADAVAAMIPQATIYMPFTDLVDIEKEIERLEKEKARLEGEINRVKGMLSNEKFISKAPEAKIAEEKEKMDKYTNMMNQVIGRLAYYSK
jgi:valyl-tRNA synthetase